MILHSGFFIFLIQMWTISMGIQCSKDKKDFKVYFKETWKTKFDTTWYKVQIYGVCPIPNTNEVNFYGNYNGMTIIGNINYTKLYQIIPFADSHVCYNDALYFVASHMLCKHAYSKEANEVECKRFEEDIYDITNLKISNSYSSSFSHVFIKTISSGYFCFFPSFLSAQNLECSLSPFPRYDNISSIITLSPDQYLISGFDQPQCYILASRFSHQFNKKCYPYIFGKGKVIKSGGSFDNEGGVLTKIEQADSIYLLHFEFGSFSIVLREINKMKEEMGQCLFSGFSEIRNSIFYSLLKCKDKTIILIKKSIYPPIIFYSNFVFSYYAGVSKERFFLFSSSENNLYLNFSNAPISSINSIEEFTLVKHYPMTSVDIGLIYYHLDLTSAANINFESLQIRQAFNASIYARNLTEYSNIDFNIDECHVQKTFYNPTNILLSDLNCEVLCSRYSEDIEYSVSYFEDMKTNSIQFNSPTNPYNLTNLPLVQLTKKLENHLFVAESSFKNKIYQSVITIYLKQCVDYCQECNEDGYCKTCLYGSPSTSIPITQCNRKSYDNLSFINVITCIIIFILFSLAIAKKIEWHSYIDACNHFQSVFFILFLSWINLNSFYHVSVLSFTLFPYAFSYAFPLVIAQLLEINCIDRINPNRYEIILGYDYTHEFFTIYIELLCLIFFCIFIIINLLKILYLRKFSKKYLTKILQIVIDHSTFYYVIFSLFLLGLPFELIKRLMYIDSYFILILFMMIFNVLLIPLSIYSIYSDFKYALKAYTMKIFDYEKEELQYLNCFFSKLRYDSEALLFNIFNNFKKLATFNIIWIVLFLAYFYPYLTDTHKDNPLLACALIYLLLLMCIECLWLFYIIKSQPYKSLSSNRILITNQIIIVIVGFCSIVSTLIVLLTNNIDSDLLEIIDWVFSICVLPISYILFSFHFIFIKTCYKKKKRFIYPRFWKLKNPNRHFASENSMTEYMAFNPYGEYDN